MRHVQWWEMVPIWRMADPATGQAVTLDKELKQMNVMFIQRHAAAGGRQDRDEQVL